MVFTSISFIYYFLPIVLVVYFILPNKFKNMVLLLSSILFYFYGEPKYILLMIIEIAIAYFSALLIDKHKNKGILALSIFIHILFLCIFKYLTFITENINSIFNIDIPLLNLVLPIGISFYTFQIISYEVDVFNKKVSAQKNFFKFATYVFFFPQLIAGPIVRYDSIANELNNRKHTFENFAYGANRFTIGLAKKVIIANSLGELCNVFSSVPDKSILFYWIFAISYMLQIYFDFSGYSDIAIGLGRIFGFHFPENFDYPYTAKSITEFWRRWHMSLGTWFRDYVYIPLGGSRVSLPRHLFNIFLVWMLTGFWHGAAWNFVIWGLYFALLLILEKIWLLEILKKSHVLNRIYVLTAAVISFVIFDATDMSQAFSYLKAMFGTGGYPLISEACSYYFRSYFVVLMIALLGATPIPKSFCRRIQQWKTGTAVMLFAEPLALSALLLICTAFLVDGSFNPFLYFRF